MNHTCQRCGLTDEKVLDLDIGSPCHPEPADCIRAMVADAEIFWRGATRALQDRDRIRYGWNGDAYGYFVCEKAGVMCRWAGPDLKDAIRKLGGYSG